LFSPYFAIQIGFKENLLLKATLKRPIIQHFAKKNSSTTRTLAIKLKARKIYYIFKLVGGKLPIKLCLLSPGGCLFSREGKEE